VKSSVLPSPGPMTGAYSLRRSRHRTMRPTARELQVLRLVAQGLSSKQIARQLGIGVSTVRTTAKPSLTAPDAHPWLR
jgi:DNA-binding CsgD family transcriptional regulator